MNYIVTNLQSTRIHKPTISTCQNTPPLTCMSCIPSGFAWGTKVSSRVGTNLVSTTRFGVGNPVLDSTDFFFNKNQLRNCYLWATLRIPKHQTPNYQFTVSSLRKFEFLKKYPPSQIFFDRVSFQRIFFSKRLLCIFFCKRFSSGGRKGVTKS